MSGELGWRRGGLRYSRMNSLPRLRSSIRIPSRSVEMSSLRF